MLLYYITDRSQFGGDTASQLAAVVERIGQAAKASVDYVQLREKDLSGGELERLTRHALAAIAAAGKSCTTKLLVNSRIDVAMASGAHGVHLPAAASGGVSAADARAVFGGSLMPRPLIAISCHSVAEVLQAWSDGADFVVLGPIFSKRSQGKHSGKKGSVKPLGLEPLRRLAAEPALKMPVLALGGVTAENAATCIAAGAAGVAGIRLFQQGSMAATVRLLSG